MASCKMFLVNAPTMVPLTCFLKSVVMSIEQSVVESCEESPVVLRSQRVLV
jgi:hypothetical protein